MGGWTATVIPSVTSNASNPSFSERRGRVEDVVEDDERKRRWAPVGLNTSKKLSTFSVRKEIRRRSLRRGRGEAEVDDLDVCAIGVGVGLRAGRGTVAVTGVAATEEGGEEEDLIL